MDTSGIGTIPIRPGIERKVEFPAGIHIPTLPYIYTKITQ